MNPTTNTTTKPRPDFPLGLAKNGQWVKKVKGRFYYFGSIKDDPQGVAALKDWLNRKDAILAGLDSLRVETVKSAWTVGKLRKEFIAAQDMKFEAGELARRTLVDYTLETAHFERTVGTDAQVPALRPEHFAAYMKVLVSERKLGRHARKRVIAYVKAMFNWGVKNGYFPAPIYGTTFVAPDTSKDAMAQAAIREGRVDYSSRIVTGEELDRILAACYTQYRAIVLVGVNVGLGPADIGRLRWRHIDMKTGEIDMRRGKTGVLRRGYLWKRTRKLLARVAKMKHNAAAIAKDGEDALVFVTAKGRPFHDEAKKSSVISSRMNRITRTLGIKGVTYYRLRHTFKTLGKKVKDRDALNHMMGHKDKSTGGIYDHEDISFKRVKRVSVAVKKALWKPAGPKPKMRLVA